jgi:hypothetical protein
MVHIHNDAHVNMAVKKSENQKRIALTARLNLDAYDVITEIQQQYRRRTGRHKCLWEVLDEAIIAYAKEQGIDFGEKSS